MISLGANARRRMAVMGCAYGNVPALRACLADARSQECDTFIFLGDATGCCGHSAETLEIIRGEFSILVTGNHEQQVASGAESCGCGYADQEDERLGCMAHQYAMRSITPELQAWLSTWPDSRVVETDLGPLLLCHGSPEQTNEFLYESQLLDERLLTWLEATGAHVLLCTHTGLPWVRTLPGNRLAVNCGAVGKPDHDGDPAVHYAVLDALGGSYSAEIRRVTYDHEAWAAQLRKEGVDPIFVEPLLTGTWTTGVASLPETEQPVQLRPLAVGRKSSATVSRGV